MAAERGDMATIEELEKRCVNWEATLKAKRP
jgi:hypothetical protein